MVNLIIGGLVRQLKMRRFKDLLQGLRVQAVRRQ